MSYTVIVINTPNDNITQLNAQVERSTEARGELNDLTDFMSAIVNGKPASFYVVTRDTDPTVTTSGTGSMSQSFNKL
jgi:hypothetical protein